MIGYLRCSVECACACPRVTAHPGHPPVEIPAPGLGYVITGALYMPIGTRKVVDGSSGEAVPEAPR